MNKKGWYLVLILGFLLVTIWLGKWIDLQSQMDFIDLALGAHLPFRLLSERIPLPDQIPDGD